jgi:hypothetical protein
MQMCPHTFSIHFTNIFLSNYHVTCIFLDMLNSKTVQKSHYFLPLSSCKGEVKIKLTLISKCHSSLKTDNNIKEKYAWGFSLNAGCK